MYAKPSHALFICFYISTVGMILSESSIDTTTLGVMGAFQLFYMFIQIKVEREKEEKAKEIILGFLDLASDIAYMTEEHINKETKE